MNNNLEDKNLDIYSKNYKINDQDFEYWQSILGEEFINYQDIILENSFADVKDIFDFISDFENEEELTDYVLSSDHPDWADETYLQWFTSLLKKSGINRSRGERLLRHLIEEFDTRLKDCNNDSTNDRIADRISDLSSSNSNYRSNLFEKENKYNSNDDVKYWHEDTLVKSRIRTSNLNQMQQMRKNLLSRKDFREALMDRLHPEHNKAKQEFIRINTDIANKKHVNKN